MGVEFKIPFERKITVKLDEREKARNKDRAMALLKVKKQQVLEKKAVMAEHKTRIDSTDQEIERLRSCNEKGEEERSQTVQWERRGGQKALVDMSAANYGEMLEIHPLDEDEKQMHLDDLVEREETDDTSSETA